MNINRIYCALRARYYKIFSVWCKYVVFLQCKCQGIELCGGTFYGIPHFRVSEGGSIKVGKYCSFWSLPTINLMGINHPCILAATPAYKGNIAVLQIGDHCGFSGVSIWCSKEIIIGDNVRVGANTVIMDGDAHYDDPRTSIPKSIKIEDNVFIGANCVIKKGVVIGKNAMIGMNSVVTHNIPANSVAVGIPAKVIKVLSDENNNSH